ncbi:uncharacterized protein LOC126621422 isoform X3 [Malus sylvestris]|uniref:uncharacterized protein LOC126621422 isoform X3 n=1 Tax=Malus sylvestris TaxID=3752 RepID=UPI0021AD0EE6|nr:uncharacterized protein LOC126621422 isoform X3 [Malus sylvestris]
MASTQNQSAHVDLFDAYFRRADLDRDGRISGNEAVAFFQGSGLPKQVLAQFREGRPLPAVLPSNIMFDLSHFFQPSNNYSNAGNVAWRPASATDAWSWCSAHGTPSWGKATEDSCSFSC